jgi:hypothetical protein
MQPRVSNIPPFVMRSAYFYLKDASRENLAAWLEGMASPNGDMAWRLPRDAEQPELDLHIDALPWPDDDAERMEPVIGALGRMPECALTVDVSGEIEGTKELCAFAERVLGAFEGVIQDEYTDHCWSLAEIRSGVRVEDHPFFDFAGWFHGQNPVPPADAAGSDDAETPLPEDCGGAVRLSDVFL